MQWIHQSLRLQFFLAALNERQFFKPPFLQCSPQLVFVFSKWRMLKLQESEVLSCVWREYKPSNPDVIPTYKLMRFCGSIVKREDWPDLMGLSGRAYRGNPANWLWPLSSHSLKLQTWLVLACFYLHLRFVRQTCLSYVRCHNCHLEMYETRNNTTANFKVQLAKLKTSFNLYIYPVNLVANLKS